MTGTESKTMDAVKPVVERDTKYITLRQGDLVAETSSQTSSSCASSVIDSHTPEEFDSLETSLENESIEADIEEALTVSAGPIVLNAILINVGIQKEGGFLLAFDVPENESMAVGRLIAKRKGVFQLVLVDPPHP